jgi:long-chain acyl-CoA synthetase
MHVRGRDLWPVHLTRDLVEETHAGRRVLCYPRPRPRTIAEMVDAAAARVPGRDALVAAGRRLTWRETAELSTRIAAALHARHGVKPGDRIALLLRNSVEFCLAVFACARLGAVAVTLNTKLRERELEFMLQNSGARLLLMNDEWWPNVAHIRAALPCEAVYVTGRPPAGTEPFERLTEEAAPAPAVAVDEDDVAVLMYTSGTTGLPKGALGTHAGVIASATSFARCCELGDGERTLVTVPLFHVTGLIAQLLTMTFLGGTTVIMPAFDAEDAVRRLDAERITHLVAAPTVYLMMMTIAGHRERGTSVRTIGYGGAPIPPHAVSALHEWFPAARLYNAYGMTETCSPTTLLPASEALARVSSVGWPVPVAEVRTVDPATGEECAVDAVGELWVRGPMVVPGYWANPEATARTMGDGWLRTGDLARIDADGYVTIMDRIKDMINRGGEKIYCVEVEDVLCAHPAVLEAAVVGVPDPLYGESVRACVVVRPGARADADGLRAWVAARLARFKVPSDVRIVETLPRNPNGKVVKSALK